MKMASIVALAALGVALSGCATIVKETHQSVAISTPPASGATCTLTSSEGTWTVTTPGVATVNKSKHDVHVTCTKEGYQDATATIPSNFEGWTLGNLILGGIVGIGVDAGTGAMNHYPDTFAVPMTPMATMPNAPVPGTSGKPAS